MASKFQLPKTWSPDELEVDRTKAIQVFVARRLKEGAPDYLRHYRESEALTESLLALTGNLLKLEPEEFLEKTNLVKDVARFVAGPPVSADDFKTLLGFKGIRRGDAAGIRDALDRIAELVDSSRFPWVSENRQPKPQERRSAVVATASLRAVERARTGRRSAEKERQEPFVAQTMRQMGLAEIGKVNDPDKDLPEGSFRRDVKFEGKQCDILVRLFDGRFLAIECKSSNSAVNSVKRLNDVFEKAQVWARERGTRVDSAAVIAGVVKRNKLEETQDKNIYLFWEHNLGPLKEFILATKKTS